MSEDDPRRAHHDLGGVERFQCLPVDTEPHTLSDFDRTVDAVRQIVSRRGLMTVDELRRGIEAIPEEEYHRLTYYQRWLRSIVGTLLRKGAIDPAELAAALERP